MLLYIGYVNRTTKSNGSEAGQQAPVAGAAGYKHESKI